MTAKESTMSQRTWFVCERRQKLNQMKYKLCTLMLVGLAAGSLVAFAQDNPPPADPQPAAPAAADTNTVAQTAQPATADADTTAAEAPSTDAATTNAPAATGTTLAAADTAAQPAADAAAQPAAAGDAAQAGSSSTRANAPVEPGAVIPLIVMDDVPLTDAIKNLARQAGLNYILDPKVSFGQPGPDGRPIPQPSVSIRWENVTAAQALTAMLGTYNLQLIEDPKSKIARVSVKDPAAPDPLVTKVVQLKFASPTNIVGAIQNTLTDKRSRVVADVRTSQLVVVATEKEIADLEPIVQSLDTMTKQVLIEARLLETSMNPSTKKGVDWSGTLENQKISWGNNAVGGVLQDPQLIMSPTHGTFFSPSTTFLNAQGVNVVLSFLNKYAEAKVLSTPRTVTLDNEEAAIQVVRASPIIQITPGSVQTAGGSSITYTNLGVVLHVTPRISANNYVNMKVVPEVSRVFDTVTRTVSVGTGQGEYQADEYDIRKIETRVMIPSGNTLVLGGLVQDDIRNGNTKVPILGDIPVVGYLFRSDSKQRQRSNLIVFLTPTIIGEEDFQPAKAGYLKTAPPTSDVLEGNWSAWDSGAPRDWSQPDPKNDVSDKSQIFSQVPNDSSK
jgi:type II secretory pathway component GspD/PulD (secretin)